METRLRLGGSGAGSGNLGCLDILSSGVTYLRGFGGAVVVVGAFFGFVEVAYVCEGVRDGIV